MQQCNLPLSVTELGIDKMHIPQHFEPPTTDAMHELIKNYPLATLVVSVEGSLQANHIPLYLQANATEKSFLIGHVSRANSLCTQALEDVSVLVIFQGPDAYISPSYYATKQETGRVVPTWNYAVVHVRGTLRLIKDKNWLLAQLQALTQQQEAKQAVPWRVSDAPAEFVDQKLMGIIGVEIGIEEMLGKWKMSQNQPPINQASLIRSLQAAGDPVASWVEKVTKV